MPDMLVPLLKLPPLPPIIESMRESGVVIRRALPHESGLIRAFVDQNFGTFWADEIAVGYANKPTSVFIALRGGHLVGFGAYECTHRGFFGPTGVAESERGRGVGKALLIACLWGLREMGYAYGVIGGAGPVDFYAKSVNATVIPDSVPGIYADPIRRGEQHPSQERRD
jgi:predicted N-acetyltransferase YhbS